MSPAVIGLELMMSQFVVAHLVVDVERFPSGGDLFLRQLLNGRKRQVLKQETGSLQNLNFLI